MLKIEKIEKTNETKCCFFEKINKDKPKMQDSGDGKELRESHWRRKWQPLPSTLAYRGAWWAAVHGVAQSRT